MVSELKLNTGLNKISTGNKTRKVKNRKAMSEITSYAVQSTSIPTTSFTKKDVILWVVME